MIHPHTERRLVNPVIGFGVFATAPIPRGTIVYARDALEIAVTPAQYAALDDRHRVVVDRYSYRDEHGDRIVSWDDAKYVNHRCECNTMSTGYGFEIAIADIAAGEEMTDEYGLFNPDEEMPVACGCNSCRGVVKPDDPQRFAPVWDRKVRLALARLPHVDQPLWEVVDLPTRLEVTDFLAGLRPYRSVATLTYRDETPRHPRPRGRAVRSRSAAA